MNTYKSLFSFLHKDFPLLANLAESAESQFHTDPSVSVAKLRVFGEKLIAILFAEYHLPFDKYATIESRFNYLKSESCIESDVANMLNIIRRLGNTAAHDPHKITFKDAGLALESAFDLAKWLYECFADEPDLTVQKLAFELPVKFDTTQIIVDLEAKQAVLEELLAKALTEKVALIEAVKEKYEETEAYKTFKERVKKASARIHLSEIQTREIIDEQLRKAGWETNTQTLNFKTQKTLPEDGRNIAIAEWKCGSKWADYALFIGRQLVGLVEAKKQIADVAGAIEQAKTYARLVSDEHIEPLTLFSNEFHVPFVFSTNGRAYNAQIRTKSGMWFLDTRLPYNLARPLQSWFSPQGLLDVLATDTEGANARLATTDFDYLTDKKGLGLRYYQINAIQKVENQIVLADTEGGRRSALLAMATGTGKTRMVLGLCYRLLKAKRFRRILFLVDRNVLGTQSKQTFKEIVIDQSTPLGDIYKIAGFEDNDAEFDKNLKAQTKSDDTTKIYFSSVQGMVHRIFNNPNANDIPPIHQYDCIIVDEAHRGYLLDKEVDDNELSFRNDADFVSKYKAVLDYFDAFRIGLTATPARHTSDIFGFPVYIYGYRQAVLDGFLVDSEPPFNIKTKLNTEGIKWVKGEKPKMIDDEGNLIELAELADELKIDVEGFNRTVLTTNFNATICAELVEHLDVDSEAKTLIFAVNNEHADTIVDELKKAFTNKGVEITDSTIMKITGSVYNYQTQINRFKNEREPNIVVTVDLLTTGVDIPKIANLVFIRRVNSRILYDQMIGRATRLCPEIGKEFFRIFDAVKLTEALNEFSDMKPVVQNPKLTMTELAADLAAADNEQGFESVKSIIIAKLQRKKQLLDNEMRVLFEKISRGRTPEAFILELSNLTQADTPRYVESNFRLLEFLESQKRDQKTGKLYSDHVDEHISTFQEYAANIYKPEDYLEKFKRHLLDNINKNTALNIIATRPQNLTCAELKNLKMELDAAGFPLKTLQTAWKNAKADDIAADIIALIRTLAMGDPLIPKEERIAKAMKKVYATQNWSAVQLGWLKRIEQRLKAEEPIIDPSFLDDDGMLRRDGGFKRMNAIFQDQGAAVLSLINEQLYVA
jgi:type I restriction enzyme, R subunit